MLALFYHIDIIHMPRKYIPADHSGARAADWGGKKTISINK